MENKLNNINQILNFNEIKYLFHCLSFFFLALLTLILFYFLLSDLTWNRDIILLLSLLSTLLSIIVIITSERHSIFGFTGIYLTYLSIAHFGVIGSLIISPTSLDNFNSIDWVYHELILNASVISGLGIAIYTISSQSINFFRKKEYDEKHYNSIFEMYSNNGIKYVGILLLLTCNIYLLVSFFAGNLPLNAPYAYYRAAIELLPSYKWFLFAFATSIPFLFSSVKKNEFKWLIPLVLIPSVGLLLTGNRGEVFFPLAAGIAVLNKKGYKFRLKHLLIGSIIFFLLIPGIRLTRSAQDIRPDSVTNIRITDPFVEIGYTMRPFIETLRWFEAGEQHSYGKTYLLPFERAFYGLFPFDERPKLTGSPYNLTERTPRQGYSVIAEAYHNFGISGVLLIMAFFGLLFSFTDSRPHSPKYLAIMGGIFAALVNNIRNSFIFVPAHIVLVIILGTFISSLLQFILRNRKS